MSNDKMKINADDRNKINFEEPDEVKYFIEKLSVSEEDVLKAREATGSDERKVLEDYLHRQKNKTRDMDIS